MEFFLGLEHLLHDLQLHNEEEHNYNSEETGHGHHSHSHHNHHRHTRAVPNLSSSVSPSLPPAPKQPKVPQEDCYLLDEYIHQFGTSENTITREGFSRMCPGLIHQISTGACRPKVVGESSDEKVFHKDHKHDHDKTTKAPRTGKSSNGRKLSNAECKLCFLNPNG